jgi:hypothetical protein
MRKSSLALFVAGVLLICSLPAFAGVVNEIILGTSSSSPVSFTGTGGGNFNVKFNLSNVGATGSGTLASSGFYSIMNMGSSVTSNGSCGNGCFLLTQTGPLQLKYGSTAGASDLLTGNLSLVDITQTAGNGGIFNDLLKVNFLVTGGGLQSGFPNNKGIVQLTIRFNTKVNLGSLLLNQTLAAKAISGAIFPVPEPASLALLSGGLLGFAGLCKKMKLLA